MNYYLKVLQNYATFSGRARRSEYWYFYLFTVIISFALRFIGNLTGVNSLDVIFTLLVLIPSIATGVRRMHDVGKSGWYLIIPIYNLILAFTEGNKGKNDYGEDPKLDAQEIDDFYNIIMAFFISAFIGCASYAFLSETKIIDGFEKAEVIKDIVLIVFFVASFIIYLTINITDKQTNKIPKQDNKTSS